MWLTCTKQSVLAAKLVGKPHHQSGRHHWRMESDRRRCKESAVVRRNAMERVGHVGCIQSWKGRSNSGEVWCRYGSWCEEWKWWGARWNSSSSWQRTMWSETLGRATPQMLVTFHTSHVCSTNCRTCSCKEVVWKNRVLNNEINKQTVLANIMLFPVGQYCKYYTHTDTHTQLHTQTHY